MHIWALHTCGVLTLGLLFGCNLLTPLEMPAPSSDANVQFLDTGEIDMSHGMDAKDADTDTDTVVCSTAIKEQDCTHNPSAGDGLDNDCDGVVDEGCSCHYKGSMEGECNLGTIHGTTGACEPPTTFVFNEVDLCDERDNDCDGQTDEGCTGIERHLASGEKIQVNFGPDASFDGWNTMSDNSFGATTKNLTESTGDVTRVEVRITDSFASIMNEGVITNSLNYPSDITKHGFWTGSKDGHADALALAGEVIISGLDKDGTYDLKLMGTFAGTFAGQPLQTRYVITGTQVDVLDLETSNNTANFAQVDDMTPSAEGTIRVRVTVAPDGYTPYGFLNLLHLSRD